MRKKKVGMHIKCNYNMNIIICESLKNHRIYNILLEEAILFKFAAMLLAYMQTVTGAVSSLKNIYSL